MCDGVPQPDLTVPLVDDRKPHVVEIYVGADLLATTQSLQAAS